ncbi:MAG TPA: hypothetical protein VI113_04635, partial [Alphaproteobacteria bacterium]
MTIAARLSGRGRDRPVRREIDARRATVGTLLVFLAPALLIYAGFTVYPVLRTFYNSFHVIKPHGVVEFVGAANFVELIHL